MALKEKMQNVSFGKLSRKEQAACDFSMDLTWRYLPDIAILPYIRTLQKYIVLTEHKGIKVQKKAIVRDAIKLPYLYIDENCKFIKFIPKYSDKEELKRNRDFYPDGTKSDWIDRMTTFYMKLLPFKTGTSPEYLLVVTIRQHEYADYWNIWFYSVALQKTNKKTPFVFSELQHNSLLASGQSTSLIENYYAVDVHFARAEFKNNISLTSGHNTSSLESHAAVDVNAERKVEPPHTGSVRGGDYDINKFNGDLFIYDGEGADTALRFVWDGEKYAQKGTVPWDLDQVREAKRSQE